MTQKRTVTWGLVSLGVRFIAKVDCLARFVALLIGDWSIVSNVLDIPIWREDSCGDLQDACFGAPNNTNVAPTYSPCGDPLAANGTPTRGVASCACASLISNQHVLAQCAACKTGSALCVL